VVSASGVISKLSQHSFIIAPIGLSFNVKFEENISLQKAFDFTSGMFANSFQCRAAFADKN